VTGILADNAHHIVAANDLAGFAKAFDGGSNFHVVKIGGKFRTTKAAGDVRLLLLD
jgi:hypothetical protein